MGRRAEKIHMLRGERRDLHSFLAELTEEEWGSPSLCEGWSVLEVAAHLASSIGVTRVGVVKRGLRYGTGTTGANRRSAAAWAAKGPAQIVASFEDPSRLGLGHFYPGWALSEAVVHHQDMRRALGRLRNVPVDRVAVALRVLTSIPTGTGAGSRLRGINARATDLDWAKGTGADVVGTAESILMVLAGRRQALAELEGPGVAMLRTSLP